MGAIRVGGTGNAWTAKVVVVACNAWSPAQAAWLDAELAAPTTYTFVVRNAVSDEITAPCLAAAAGENAATILAAHPYTLLITGSERTFAYSAADKQVIVGNGGAPLSGDVDYGYVIAQQQPNGDMLFEALDYQTGAELAGSPFTVPP